MFATYTAKYTKITTGYMGQLVEWPEIVTEGRDIEDCRDMLRDTLNEMILAYQHQGKEISYLILATARQDLIPRLTIFTIQINY